MRQMTRDGAPAGDETALRILLVHNFYQRPGGEDLVFAEEMACLKDNGHAIASFTLHNDAIDGMGRLALAAKTVWNRQSCRELDALVEGFRPQVVHFHNTFPLISPGAYRVAHRHEAAVVQTLHNYRLLCPAATLLRDGRPCTECVGRRLPWPGVVHNCYRQSRSATAVTAGMLAAHRLLGTWSGGVDLYLALTEFSRGLFVQGGLPPERIIVKGNCVPDPLCGADPGEQEGRDGYALFVGRLSAEKGIDTLLAAWRLLDGSISLKIAGDGPLADPLRAAAQSIPGIEWLGQQSGEQVRELMRRAAMLIFPSVWYETFGRVIVEAFGSGTPVIASDLGAAAELVDGERTGLLFRPGDAEHLAQQVRRLATDALLRQRMGRDARQEYEAKYTVAQGYQSLMAAYERALAKRWGARSARGSQMLRSTSA